MFAGLILVGALVSTVFLREVPMTGARTGMAFGEGPPVESDEEPEREAATA